MIPITINDSKGIAAHHTTETALSRYNQPVWVVERSPESKTLTWRQGHDVQKIKYLGLYAGWLIGNQSNGYTLAIIWSDGDYYADLLTIGDGGKFGEPVKLKSLNEIDSATMTVRGTVKFPSTEEGEENIGAIVSAPAEVMQALAAVNVPPQNKCLRCGHSWYQRGMEPPETCPNCGSSKWHTPRTGKEPGPKPRRGQNRDGGNNQIK